MKLWGAFAVLILAGMVAAAPALAQNEDQQPGAPLRLVAPPPALPSAPPPQGETAAPPAGVNATTLAPIDPSWSDALPKGETGFDPAMWQGTARAVVRALLPLVGATESPALRALSRRLLLSGATAPAGSDPPDQPGLVLLRAQAVARLGAIAGAKKVLDDYPADKLGEDAQRLRIELAFADNDVTDGCQRVVAGLIGHQNVWWDQASIACQLLSGDRDKAALALDVLHDRDASSDPTFDALVAGANGGRGVKLDKHAVLSPVRALLWAMSKRPLPAEILAMADAPTLAAFAGSGAPVSVRLPAAERAAALGAWSAERLGELYGKLKFSDAERAKVLDDDGAGDTATGRAVLFAIAQKDPDPTNRVTALLRFGREAARQDFFFVAARLTAPIIMALGPSDATKGAAPFFIRFLIAADRAQNAAPWLAQTDNAASPLVTVAQALAGSRPDERNRDLALGTLLIRAKDSVRAIGLYLMLMNEYGAPPPASELAAQMVPARTASSPNAAVWLDLQRAAAARRFGETVLASVVVAEDGAHPTTDPIVLQRVLGALRAVGLDAEGRALARDAAVASGL